MAILSASEQREILQAAKIEDSSALMGITKTENDPKPWYQALKDLVNAYKESVDQETKDPKLLIAADHMRREAGQEFSLGRVETVAHYFADGCIPKNFYGLMSLLMIQPSVNDLNKCELRRSAVGGVGGLGCFLRPVFTHAASLANTTVCILKEALSSGITTSWHRFRTHLNGSSLPPPIR
jgi:hypothetical protein